MNENNSVIQEKAYGTYKRNETIRRLRKNGKTVKELAELFGITKQAISVICRRGNKKQ